MGHNSKVEPVAADFGWDVGYNLGVGGCQSKGISE